MKCFPFKVIHPLLDISSFFHHANLLSTFSIIVSTMDYNFHSPMYFRIVHGIKFGKVCYDEFYCLVLHFIYSLRKQ